MPRINSPSKAASPSSPPQTPRAGSPLAPRMIRSARVKAQSSTRRAETATSSEKPAQAPRRRSVGPTKSSSKSQQAPSQSLSFFSAFAALLVAPVAATLAALHRSVTRRDSNTTMFDAADRYALLLSLLAGLATSVGGIIAVWRKPDNALLAFLLGTAIGVMATLSVVELYVKNVLENGFVGISLATASGAMVYVVVEPLLPKAEVLEGKVNGIGGGNDEAENGGVSSPHTPNEKVRSRVSQIPPP